MDEAIVDHVKKEYKLLIGPRQRRDQARDRLGACAAGGDPGRGARAPSRASRGVILSSDEVRHALDEPVGQIIDAIKQTLDNFPPELAADIMDRGLMLTTAAARFSVGSTSDFVRKRICRSSRGVAARVRRRRIRGGGLEEFEVIHRSAAGTTTTIAPESDRDSRSSRFCDVQVSHACGFRRYAEQRVEARGGSGLIRLRDSECGLPDMRSGRRRLCPPRRGPPASGSLRPTTSVRASPRRRLH